MLIICFDTYIEFIQPFLSPRMMIGYDNWFLYQYRKKKMKKKERNLKLMFKNLLVYLKPNS